jgi:hypothetical protein
LSQGAEGGLVFAISISSFTKRGYVGSASYKGRSVDFEFDDRDAGIFLTPEMCKLLRVREGSKVLLVVEAEGEPLVTEATVSRATSKPRISSAKVYYEVGREGGAIMTLRKAQ